MAYSSPVEANGRQSGRPVWAKTVFLISLVRLWHRFPADGFCSLDNLVVCRPSDCWRAWRGFWSGQCSNGRYVHAEDRASSFGKVGAASGLVYAGPSAWAAFLGEFGAARVPFFVAGGLAFGNGIYGYFVFPETMAARTSATVRMETRQPTGSLCFLGRIKGIFRLPPSIFFGRLPPTSIRHPGPFYAIQYGWSSR